VLGSLEGRSEGDPRKIADVIVRLATSRQRVQQAEAAPASEAEKFRHLTVSTVFEEADLELLTKLYLEFDRL
jgi:hypothetical protein